MERFGYRSATWLVAASLLSACGGSSNGGSTGPVVAGGGAGDSDGNPAGIDGPIRNDELPDGTGATGPERWFESYETADDVQACSAEDLKRWIDHDLRDYYVYADRVIPARLEDYADENALVRALRIAPDEFSNVGDTREFDTRYEEGIVVDFGFRWTYVDASVRFQRVDEGSPAGAAGLLRGDVLIAIDGVLQADLTDDDYERLYARAEGETARFTVRTGQAPTRDIDIAQAAYVYDTVPLVQSLDYPDGRSVGYLAVSSFLDPTDEQLDRAFDFFAERGVSELVLDLRYNGGGRSRVGNRLASRLGGRAVAGQVYANQKRNDTYTTFDSVETFREVDRSLDLSRMVVLTTRRSASASENLINGLRPFLDVTVIGQTTRGKPFSSQGIDYCGRTASLMNSIISNSAGVSVAGGIAPDCTVEDTVDFAIDDNRDALRAAALDYLAAGTCPVGLAAKTSPGTRPALPEGKAFEPMALR